MKHFCLESAAQVGASDPLSAFAQRKHTTFSGPFLPFGEDKVPRRCKETRA